MDRRELLQAGVAAGVLGMAAPRLMAEESGEPPDATLWLNWNENPAGLSPGVRDAARGAVDRAHRYPDRARAELASRLAELNGVAPENVVLGCGSTQILRAVVAAWAGEAERLVLAEPTFEAMVRYQEPLGYRVIKVPLDRRWAHDLTRMQAAVGRAPSIIYLCNPNNPTATLTPSAEIDAWIRQAPETSLFVVDEAYYEYVEEETYASAAHWVLDRPNVVVTRTFSKIYAMAGLRLGYGLAQGSTARRLRSSLSADNVNGVAIAAALASLADGQLVPASRRLNRESRRIALECLDELQIDHLPSHANFLMHRVEGDLLRYRESMRERGIRVGRPFPPLTEFNRLSLGLPAEMRRWAAALRELRAGGLV